MLHVDRYTLGSQQVHFGKMYFNGKGIETLGFEREITSTFVVPFKIKQIILLKNYVSFYLLYRTRDVCINYARFLEHNNY
jgi:hypothetical protein